MLVFILIYIFIFMLAIEVFTVTFQISGISREKARFQVLSMLTNSGFKTKESELLTNDPLKRKIATFIMAFTYISLLIFISSLVYLSVKGDVLTFFVYAIAEIILFYSIFTMIAVRKIIYKLIQALTKKYVLEKNANTLKILEEFNNKVLAHIWIEKLTPEFEEIEIGNIESLTTLDVTILAIERPNLLITTVLPNQKLLSGDKITVYGDLINIQFLFKVEK